MSTLYLHATDFLVLKIPHKMMKKQQHKSLSVLLQILVQLCYGCTRLWATDEKCGS